MRNLGTSFRQLRLDRHLTLQQVADDQCSLAFVSKFERGERAIGFTRLWHLLDRINVAPEEFFQVVSPTPTIGVQETAELADLASLTTPYAALAMQLVASIAQNTSNSSAVTPAALTAMAQIGEATLQADGGNARWQQFLSIMRQIGVLIVKNNQQNDPQQDAELFMTIDRLSQPVVAYLFTLEQWGIFEFTLLRLFATALSAETLYRLVKLAVARSQALRQLPQGQALVMAVLQGAVSKFINTKHFDWAQAALAWRQQLTPADGVRWALESRFLQGWVQLAQGDATGESLCLTVIAMLETLGLQVAAKRWRRRFKAIQRSIADPEHWAVYL